MRAATLLAPSMPRSSLAPGRLACCLVACCLVWAPAALAQDVALVGGRVLPVEGPALDSGTVLIRGGRIVEVGDDVTVPEGVRRIDCKGRVVTPGLIDADSMLGLDTGDRTGNRVSLDQSATAAFDPWDAQVRTALGQGVTCVLSTGNSRDLKGGTAGVVLLRPGRTVTVGGDGALVFNVSTGSNADGAWGAQRAHGFAGVFRGLAAYQEAHERYRRDLAEYAAEAERTEPTDEERLLLPRAVLERLDQLSPEQRAAWREAAYKAMGLPKRYTKPKDLPKPPRAPGANVETELLLETVSGEGDRRRVLVRAELSGDLGACLDVVEEHGLRATVLGGTGLLDGAQRLRRLGTPVVLTHLGDARLHDEGPLADRPPGLAASLVQAGLEPALASGDAVGGTRFLRLLVAREIGEGLSAEDGLRTVTLWAARAAGVEAELGSITAGKRGDVVVWSGDPFAATTRVERVFVGGEDALE